MVQDPGLSFRGKNDGGGKSVYLVSVFLKHCLCIIPGIMWWPFSINHKCTKKKNSQYFSKEIRVKVPTLTHISCLEKNINKSDKYSQN